MSDYSKDYYESLYINPLFSRLGISNLYYLWIACFCIIRAGSIKNKNKVLDVGCGIGNLVWALRKFNINAWGIEPSKAAKDFCRFPNYCFYTNTDRLPYPDNTFEIVYTNEVLEHIQLHKIPKFLKELKRICSGKIIHMICVKERGEIAYNEPTHHTIRSEKWWTRQFKKIGYQVQVGNFFYFYPFVFYLFSGKINFTGIKKGYFLLTPI